MLYCCSSQHILILFFIFWKPSSVSVVSYSPAIRVCGSPKNRTVKSCKIWHTDQGQCPDSCHQVSCHHLKHSSATNRSKSWVYEKVQKKCHQPHIFTNLHQKWHRWSSDQASQKLSEGFFIFESICPSKPIEICDESVKQRWRVFMHATFEPYGEKVWKFDTLIRNSVLILVIKFHAPNLNTLAPPMGQMWIAFMILWKGQKMLHRPHTFTNLYQNWHRWSSNKPRWISDFRKCLLVTANLLGPLIAACSYILLLLLFYFLILHHSYNTSHLYYKQSKCIN